MKSWAYHPYLQRSMQDHRLIMFDEDQILSDLKALLGKEFYLTEFCQSNKYNFDDFTKFFFELDEQDKINFSLTKKGGIRLVQVLLSLIHISEPTRPY